VLADRSAVVTDVPALMAAIPALARSLRYGDVRQTPVASLRSVVEVMLLRACVGLPVAVTGLDDSAAEDLREALDGVASAVAVLDDESLRAAWLDALAGVHHRDDVHGLLAGRITRLLTDAGRLTAEQTQQRLGQMLTVGTLPARAAAYVEGFFAGAGLLLVHDRALLDLVDRWLLDVPADTFPEVLPLLRRTFGAFAEPERRAVLDRVGHLGSGRRATSSTTSTHVDEERARRVLPVVHELLGWSR